MKKSRQCIITVSVGVLQTLWPKTFLLTHCIDSMMFSYHNNNREFDILELPSVDSFDKMSGDSKIKMKCFFVVHTCVTHPLF